MRGKHIPIVVAALAALFLAGCGGEDAPSSAAPTARYVDPARCTSCHERETKAWTGSHHDLAMQEATESTVLGDFDDAVFTHHGVETRFFRENGAFRVETEGRDGRPATFNVAYVFGIDPLQQVLLDVGDGRLQAFTVCWDVHEKRWFPLYDERIPPDDPLHWTGPYESWNYMCAECHTTNLRRGYDVATNTYHTMWSEMHVGCQACHGPGSEHVAWAERVGDGHWEEGDPKGLVVDLGARDAHVQIEACARCHSRRNIVHGDYEFGHPLLDDYEPELLVAPLYFPDGQILDEVYVYGSFVQSKMYAQGVRCTDCHDPHSARPKARGNALCARCHQPNRPAGFPTLKAAEYDTPAHHHHAEGTAGSFCVDCHMPATTYMQVDPRRDHSFRVPRPDLTVSLGVPNPCTGCHAKEGAAWASERIRAWFPESRQGTKHFATTLAAARKTAPEALPDLLALTADGKQPAIVRATALREARRYSGRPVWEAVIRALGDEDGLVRATALDGVNDALRRDAPPRALQEKLRLLAPLLSDPLRLVRTEAARGLACVPASLFDRTTRAAFERALTELVEREEAVEDRPDGWLNLGVLYEDLGRDGDAEQAYLHALRIDEGFLPVRFNLATLYNRLGRNAEAEQRLREVLDRMPGNGEAWYSLGLLLAEMERYGDAATALSRAASLLPGRPRIHYNRALVLQRLGRNPEAEKALEQAHDMDPRDPRVVQALAVLALHRRRWDEATRWAQELGRLLPGDPAVQQLLDRVRDASR